MKILFMLELYKPHNGGVETLFHSLITRLVEKGHEVTVLTTRFRSDIPEMEAIGKNLTIVRVGHNRYDYMLYSFFKGLKMAKDFDLIHTTTYNAAVPASLVGFFRKKKVVITVHEIFGMLWYKFMGWKGFFFKLYESFIFKFRFDRFICDSVYTNNSLRIHFGLDDRRMHMIHCGMDYDFWNARNFKSENIESVKIRHSFEERFVGMYWGRPGISKGLEYYIMSIPSIIKRIPEFKAFLIVPNNEKRRFAHIQSLIRDLDLSKDHLELVTGVKYEDLGNYILASDFVIIPSLAEGFGFNVVEAANLGAKLIVTNIGSIPEVVSGEVIFIDPANPDSIASAVVEAKKGNFKHIPVKSFSWDEHVAKVESVYQSMMNELKSPSEGGF